METSTGATRSSSVWSPNLVFAILASLCIGICNQLLLPTMPIYIVRLGVATSYAGIMSTAYCFGALLFRPVAGQLADTVGRKKILVLGVAVCASVSCLYNFAPNFPVLLVMRIINGLGMCLANTALGTMVADVIPPDRMTEGIGYYGLSGAIAQTAGPALGLAVMGVWDIQGVFLATAATSVFALVFGMCIHYKEKVRAASRDGHMKIMLVDKDAATASSMQMLMCIAQSALTSFLALYGLSIGVEGLGDFFLVIAVGIISSRLLVGRITSRFNDGHFLTFVTIVAACCMASVSMARSYYVFMGIALIYGFGYGNIFPLTKSMSLRHVKEENRGCATATYSGFCDLGTLIGSFFWGFVVENMGYRFLYLAAACLILAINLIYYGPYKKRFPQG